MSLLPILGFFLLGVFVGKSSILLSTLPKETASDLRPDLRMQQSSQQLQKCMLLSKNLRELTQRSRRDGAVVLTGDEILVLNKPRSSSTQRQEIKRDTDPGATDQMASLTKESSTEGGQADTYYDEDESTGESLEWLALESSSKRRDADENDELLRGDKALEDEIAALRKNDEPSQSLQELASRAGIDLTVPHHRNPQTWAAIPAKYRLQDDEEGRFFLYQPSGGWGNQRLILRWAIIAANAMNRTLVLPPVAPHANFYAGFNKFSSNEVLNMGQVLDLDTLASRVQAGIRVHDGDMTSYETKILQNRTWRVYERPQAISFIQEKMILRRWASETADVVYWHKTSMWKCCATMDVNYYAFIQYGMEFSKTLQGVALQSVTSMVPRYNAIHFRRGDSQIMERRNVHKYVKYHRSSMRYMNRSLPLYIATDERDRAMFQPLITTYGFSKLVFAEDLAEDIMGPFMAQVPATMRGDVYGFIDQIICVYAEQWSGSALSTFSYVISAMRNNRLRRGKYFVKLQQLGGESKFLPRTSTMFS
mmetsp:Transcript_22091/g.43476  ORF Transcript_22091/g.43476 Transcript_22091/m.43476 type:complete len:536 (-) Transcript_22091:87-1694(-)